MAQENKKLLLKDLCARLPNGIKIWYKYYPTNFTEKFATSIRLADEKIALSSKLNEEGDWFPIEEANEILIKPYLRPMSSMTEEESYDYYNTFEWEEDWNGGHYPNSKTEKTFDWLNANHFDYRGLIPMGLALEAPKDMYNIKEK